MSKEDLARLLPEQLGQIVQGKYETIAVFLTRFEDVLARCQLEVGETLNEASNITWLESALSERYLEAMVHHPDVTTFAAYRDQLLKIGIRLEGVRLRKAPAQGAASYAAVSTPADPDAIDLRAGKVASSGGPGTSKKDADRE
ncbi:hypothetical protein SEPCBS119000_000388 [Sporothrix epigloea]|uniref:Uncharacterized protein n=1 Tax=Sporothrix epigloea TaxID=1892477 RepID=A0ABP0D4T8_9PEZI